MGIIGLERPPTPLGAVAARLAEESRSVGRGSAVMIFSDVGATLELVRNGVTERVIPLRGADLHIGRHSLVGVTLDHPKVSLYHARIERRFDGSYRVVDLMSKNGTFVDDEKLKPFEPEDLREGSRIRIVDYEFVFREAAARVAGPGGPARSTVLGRQANLTSTQLARRTARPAEALRAVLDIVRALGGGADLDERLAQAVDGLLLVFPRAERAFIVAVEPGGALPLLAHRHVKGPAEPPVLSRAIVDEVLGRGEAVLIKDVLVDDRFKNHDSVAASIRTAIIAPLAGRDGRSLGMIQLDGATPNSRFDEEALDLLAALAVPIATAVENDLMARERASWAAAREIQLALLPRSRPAIPGYAIWESYRPAEDVGGDLYDYIAVDGPEDGGGGGSSDGSHQSHPPRWLVTLGDVAGHGMAAAIVMAGIGPEVRLLLRDGLPPAEVLARVNRRHHDTGIEGRFVTMIIAELDPLNHRMSVTAAGHPSPLIRRSDGRVEGLDCAGGGPPLGVRPNAVYEPTEFDLSPGEVVVFYSDGVDEALDLRQRVFGVDRLKAVVGKTRGGPAEVGEAILAALADHMVGRSQVDDVTIVCFGRDRDADETV